MFLSVVFAALCISICPLNYVSKVLAATACDEAYKPGIYLEKEDLSLTANPQKIFSPSNANA